MGAYAGAAAGIAGGIFLVASGAVSCPFTLGGGCVVAVVGVTTISGVIGGYVIGSGISETFNNVKEFFNERDINTVYFTKLNQITEGGDELCKFVESV